MSHSKMTVSKTATYRFKTIMAVTVAPSSLNALVLSLSFSAADWKFQRFSGNTDSLPVGGWKNYPGWSAACYCMSATVYIGYMVRGVVRQKKETTFICD